MNRARLIGPVGVSAVVLAAGGLTPLVQAGNTTHRVIALTGVDNVYGPGMGAGITFSSIGQQQPSINSTGQVAFRANQSTAGTPHGVWVHNGAVNNNVATAGGAQPGGGTYTSGTAVFNSTLVNDAGDWAFRLGASTGLFASSSGTPGRSMLTGDAAPGAGGALYSSSATGMPLFNQAGQSGFVANLAASATSTPPTVTTSGIANTSGVWGGAPGSTSLLLRQNDPVLSLDAGGAVRIGAFQAASMAYNGGGRYAVTAALQGTVVTGNGAGSNASLIASDRTGSLEVIARVGNASPDGAGLTSSSLYRNFSSTAIGMNDAGRIAFSCSLRDAAGTQTATGALFSDTGTGTMHLIGKSGDAMPGTITNSVGAEFSGVTWGFSFGAPMLNSGGSLAFSAGLAGNVTTSNNGALFRMDPAGAMTKIQRNGDVAILGGAPDGSNARFLGTTNIQINTAGEIVFQCTLTGTGVSVGLGNGSALYGADVNGILCLLARTGDMFEVAPGDMRQIATIGGIANSGGQDGHAMSLNNRGEVVFELDFVGGSSGIFVASVPDPGALSLLGLGALGAARRRRR